MAQQTIINCEDMQLVLAVLRWLEENIQEVVLENLAAESNNNQAWTPRLENTSSSSTSPNLR